MEELQFLGCNVEIIRKLGRRSLTLVMRPEKPLSVRTNRKTTQIQIAEFLQLKQKWIEKNLLRFKVMAEQFQKPDFTEGARYPFFGEFKLLKFSEAQGRRVLFKVNEEFLICGIPRGRQLAEFSESILRRDMGRYYRGVAEAYLQARLGFWVMRTGLKPSGLVFRSNRTRWGSCSAQGMITLNWKLICQPVHLIDYVIVHELCHLRHLNHSTNFWQLVGEFFPDHKKSKFLLNQQHQLSHFLD